MTIRPLLLLLAFGAAAVLWAALALLCWLIVSSAATIIDLVARSLSWVTM